MSEKKKALFIRVPIDLYAQLEAKAAEEDRTVPSLSLHFIKQQLEKSS